MNKIITNELVYFTGVPSKKRDFSGNESAFSENERMEFLSEYQKHARKWYNDEHLDKKAVSDIEVNEFLDTIKRENKTKIRKTLYFDTMTACEAYKTPKINGLHLYLGACVENDEIVFPEREIRPTPCALYETEAMEEIKVGFDVFIPADYKCTQDEKCGVAQMGRTIELRSKTIDKVKIKLLNSGEILSMSKDKWEPEETLIGNVLFGKWNEFLVEAGERISITANGKKFENIEPTCEGKIDGIFFDGGMFPRGEWRIRNLKINDNVVDFSENGTGDEKIFEEKEVKLPYSIGTYNKKDRRLYLTKTFEVCDFTEAKLNIETLDPCGRAWINGELVLDTDTFTKNEIIVTEYLKNGVNELKIMVEPRPPEVYYYWHRHNDCYNGWFCGEVSLELVNDVHISDVQVRTKSALPSVLADAAVELNKEFCGKIRLYAKKCYPENGEEIYLCEKEVCSKRVDLEFSSDFQLWDINTPNLYQIRAVLLDVEGNEIDDFSTETGFRTIEQKNGEIYLNNKKTLLNGALQMQFLPPFEDVPVNHNCPSDFQIAQQAMMLRKMNGNIIRLHILGYGTNEERYARIFDRLGIMLVWITRFIDTLEELVWDDGRWHEKDEYIKQLKAVANHPSIVMYEGSNEYHAKDLGVLDRMYDEFIDAVKSFDTSRLLTPVSHLYYGGGIYEMGCTYYNDDGTKDHDGNSVKSGHGWVDKDVIRSSHTYTLLCGYGDSWEAMRKQNWKWQPEMLESKEHSYLITEYAVTALPNPNTKEAEENEYIDSYERPDEIGAIGRIFKQSEWRESQALQALCAFQGVKLMRSLGVDGMLWCCLMSGANNGSYMKPPIDFYGYKKLGFYALRDAYRPVYAAKSDIDLSYGSEDSIYPLILNSQCEGTYDLAVYVLNDKDEVLCSKEYKDIKVKENAVLEAFKPEWENEGYYTLKFELIKK